MYCYFLCEVMKMIIIIMRANHSVRPFFSSSQLASASVGGLEENGAGPSGGGGGEGSIEVGGTLGLPGLGA